MGWSWHEYHQTPCSVLVVLCEMVAEQQDGLSRRESVELG